MNTTRRTADLIARIDQLERRQARLAKLVGVALLVLLVAASASAPRAQPSVLEATEFRLVDQKGEMLARLAADLGDPQLVLMSPSGAMASVTPRLLSISSISPLRDENRTALFSMRVGSDSVGSGIRIAGAHGELRFVSVNGAPTLELVDSAGHLRVAVGRTRLSRPATGSTEITSEASITLFDAHGNVIWRAPLG